MKRCAFCLFFFLYLPFFIFLPSSTCFTFLLLPSFPKLACDDEKATLMAKMMGEDPLDASWVSSKTLAASYTWELRMFWMMPIISGVYVFHEPWGIILLGLMSLIVMFMDLFFTVISTNLFLRPILSAMAHASDAHRSTPGFKGMQQTKYATLFGSIIATMSSTLLYINLVLHVFIGGEWHRNPYLHPLVFMVNMDSIFNCLGMLLVSGVPKKLFSMFPWRRNPTV
jgi:hypothetical protein